MDMTEILLKLSKLRTEANLSARELSLRIGMSAQYFGQVERGRITLSVPVLLKILEVLKVSPAKFFSSSDAYDTDMALLNHLKMFPKKKREALLLFLTTTD